MKSYQASFLITTEIRNQLQEENCKKVKNADMLLNNKYITKEIKHEIKKYLETNENKNTMIQNP